jgi:hypothetical protein
MWCGSLLSTLRDHLRVPNSRTPNSRQDSAGLCKLPFLISVVNNSLVCIKADLLRYQDGRMEWPTGKDDRNNGLNKPIGWRNQ